MSVTFRGQPMNELHRVRPACLHRRGAQRQKDLNHLLGGCRRTPIIRGFAPTRSATRTPRSNERYSGGRTRPAGRIRR